VENKKVSKILEKFEKSKRQRQKKNHKWKELDAFDRGEQWELGGTKVPAWVPKPVTNYVHLVKTTKRAALAIENPEAMIMGQTAEDHKEAKNLEDVFEFVWNKMKARKTVREVLETSKLLGTGIAQVYYDDENQEVKGGKGRRYQGEIKIKQLDPSVFFPDPNAFRMEDCEFINVSYQRPLDWVKAKFNISDLQANELSNEEQGKIYNRDYSSENKDKLVHYLEHYEKIPDKENGGFKYQLTILAGNQIIRDTKPLKPNRYPFAVLYDFPQRQDFWGQSTCEIILDNQKLINKIESIMALIGSLLQNPQKIIHKRSGINPEEASKYGSTPGHTWVSDIDVERAMTWQNPPQIPQPLFQLAEQARANVREITGLTEAYMGQSVGSLQTSSGVDSLIERSTMRDKDQMYDFELFIEELSHIIIGFITEYYTDMRVARILKEDDQEPEVLDFIGSDYKALAYDISIDVSAKAPITRIRKQEGLDKLLTLQGQMQFDPAIITQQEYMRESDFIEKKQIIERMNQDEINGKNAILQETLEMATEAMQEGVNPEEIAQMAEAMLTQRLEEKQQGTGDTAEHSGEMQQRQGQAQVDIGM